MRDMISLHYNLLNGVAVWDANYTPSPLQVSRYASTLSVRPDCRTESREVSEDLCPARRVVLYILYFGKSFGI